MSRSFRMISIVVARYNEDIAWTKPFPNVVVYNKGKKLPEGEYNEICLENVGREGHTFYKHICDNYDRLEDYTIFLQGRPFDHSPNIIKKINTYIEDSKINLDFELLSDFILTTNLKGCRHHGGLSLMGVYRKLFEHDGITDDFEFGAGGQFIVSKQRILKRPKEFYLKIVEMLKHSVNPIEGYVLERLHPLIFG